MTQPILVLAEGTYRYYGTNETGDTSVRVFIVDWTEGVAGQSWATVILREPAYLQNEYVRPVPVGALRRVFAGGGEQFETYLTVDVP